MYRKRGFNTCLDKAGNVYGDKTEKSAWMQAKQVWMYTQLHRKLDRFRNQDIYHAAVKGNFSAFD